MTSTLLLTDLEARRNRWCEDVATSRNLRTEQSARYRTSLVRILKHIVMPDARVLQLGCGTGEILAAVHPSRGLGIEIAPKCVQEARARNVGSPQLEFVEGDPESTVPDEEFDYVIASDLLLDCFDVDDLLTNVRKACSPSTRLVLTNYSQLWRPLLKFARALGFAKPRFGRTWFSPADLRQALARGGFEVVYDSAETLIPVAIPVVSTIANRFLAKLPFFRALCLHRVMVARLAPERAKHPMSVTVLVPARNESGNITRILNETPQMGAWTELLFVEGNSTDDTWEVLQKAVAERNDPRIRLLKQPGKGKGDAVRAGFAEAKGEILMILDADLTVPAEMLPRFYEAIHSGHAEFANGTRLVYGMDDRAMQFLNLLANHFFARAFSFVLSQPVRDTLCGTKVLTKANYQRLAQNRKYFGAFDPFGDFDLLFGAARLNFKISDIPIRYRERVYGETNISRFRHGLLLFRMLFIGALKLKFR
ncbi:MAG: glycosyltransferase [Phycisphaerales bacterium]|nr:glycosyltransferase [Phycisphaerales bacterium]